MGPAGPAGPTGPKGATGATGATGAAGAAGPPGVVKVLDFDATWSPTNLLGNNGNAINTPVACRTASYVATSGDVAVVNFHGTATPSNAVNDVLYINVMTSVNGAGFAAQTLTDSAESMSDGTANASVSKRITLNAGSTYVFGAGFSSNAAVSISTGFCEGTVLIVKQ